VIGRLRRLRTRVAVALSPFTIGLGTAGPAWADTAGGITAVGLNWLRVTDSDNVPIQAYGLSLNQGSVLDPGAAGDSFGANWLFGVFKAVIELALWLIDNVLSFSWLQVVSAPLNYVGTRMAHLALSPAVIGVFGTLAAVIIAIGMVRGLMSRAGAQIATALVLAFVAVTLGGRQVAELVGPTGVLALGRDIAFELSTLLSPGGPRSGIAAVTEGTQALADHFARTPTQLWNFGRSLDALSPECGRVWSAAMASGQIDDLKEAVRQSCPGGQALHDYAMTKAAGDSSTGLLAIVFALVALVVFGYLAYHVVILALSALFWAIITVLAAVAGFMPGPVQSLAVKAALDTVFSLLGMMGYIFVLSITGNLVSAIFTTTGDAVMALPFAAMLLAAVFFALRKVSKKLSEMREFTADRASTVGARPGHTVPADMATMVGQISRPAYRPGTELGRLDPLTAVPAAGVHVRRIARSGAAKLKTAATSGASPATATAAAAGAAAAAKGVVKPSPKSAAGRGAPQQNGRGAPATRTTPAAGASQATRARRTRTAKLAANPTAAAAPPAAAPHPSRPTPPPRPGSPSPRRAPAVTQQLIAAPPAAAAASPPVTAGAAAVTATSRRPSPATPHPAAGTPPRPPAALHPALREVLGEDTGRK
jgi:hypothetical protein